MKKWFIKRRNKFANWLFKMAAKIHVSEKEKARKGSKAKVIAVIACMAVLSGCTAKNTNVQTVSESAKQTIERVVALKPECKDVGEICKEQIDTVNAVCQTTIKEERSESFWSGFWKGILSVFAGLLVLGFLWNRFAKK